MKGRAKHITKGADLRKEDDKTRSVRFPPDSEHHDGAVDYEKLWKHIREDGAEFWHEFLKVQEKLCGPCQKAFTEANVAARSKMIRMTATYGGLAGNGEKMEIKIIIDDQQLGPILEGIAKARGVPVASLAKRFIEQSVGRVCLTCAGMGTDDDAKVCAHCAGTGNRTKSS